MKEKKERNPKQIHSLRRIVLAVQFNEKLMAPYKRGGKTKQLVYTMNGSLHPAVDELHYWKGALFHL